MSREAARTKADRLLLEGRLVLLEVNKHRAIARCRGEGAIHSCGYQSGLWTCTCPARTDQCSHLIALRRVVAVDLKERR